MNRITAIVALSLVSSLAFAAGAAKKARPMACENFDVFKDANGVEIGVCGATKPGGRASTLRSFAVATVIDPTTDKPVKVLVGFR